MLKTLFLSAILALAAPAGEIFSEANYNHLIGFLESYLNTSKKSPEAAKLLESQKEDGTWASVDYKDKLRGAWKTAKHMENYRTLAVAYHATGNVKYLDAARKALKYWYETMPTCPNWWYNQIGIPRAFGPATLLIMKDLPQEDIDGAIKILKLSRFGHNTGQNLLWQSENIMMRAYLEKDEDLLMEARDSIDTVIRIEPEKEGIKPDWSFHQHGPQLQWGNYGGGFAGCMSWLVMLFDGTPLAFSESQRNIVTDYIRYGVTMPIWKGYYDLNASGRQITAGLQKTKARNALAAARRIGVEPDEFTGGRFYPYSDFGIYKTKEFYASIRMQSERTIGMEQTNKENMRGRFAADGALLVRREGDEYKDVAAAWNWHHVPGVTCFDDGKEIFGWKVPKDKKYNLSGNVGGDVDGEYMTVHMELVREGLTAHKAWFFFPEGIVCLGSGISLEREERVVTGVEQCVIREDVVSTSRFIHHNGITYIPLGSTKFKVDPEIHSGDWGAIHPAKKGKKSTLNLLDVWIDHGVSPSDAGYAYAVIADGKSGKEALKNVKKNIKILENTPGCQSVSINGKILTVKW